MSEQPPLRALAAWAGIADEYIDIWGRHHPTSDGTREALLRAMSIDTTKPQQTLAALRDRDWVNGLRPVLVVNDAVALYNIDLYVAIRHGNDPHAWTLTLESGQVLHGDADVVENGPHEVGELRARPSRSAAAVYGSTSRAAMRSTICANSPAFRTCRSR